MRPNASGLFSPVVEHSMVFLFVMWTRNGTLDTPTNQCVACVLPISHFHDAKGPLSPNNISSPFVTVVSADVAQGCWNLAVRCCGSTCDLPWADSVGRSATNDRCDLVMTDVIPVSRQEELLVLAPAFFKASGTFAGLTCTTSPLARTNGSTVQIACKIR